MGQKARVLEMEIYDSCKNAQNSRPLYLRYCFVQYNDGSDNGDRQFGGAEDRCSPGRNFWSSDGRHTAEQAGKEIELCAVYPDIRGHNTFSEVTGAKHTDENDLCAQVTIPRNSGLPDVSAASHVPAKEDKPCSRSSHKAGSNTRSSQCDF